MAFTLALGGGGEGRGSVLPYFTYTRTSTEQGVVFWLCCPEEGTQFYHPLSLTESEPVLNRVCLTNTLNSRKGQRTNQKYRNLVGSDQQIQGIEETELRKADRTAGINFIYFPIFRQTRPDFFRECLQLRKDVTINKGVVTRYVRV